MLLVVFLCFNWCAGLSLTGPMVHFYVRQIKETEREGDRMERGRMEADTRRSPGAEVTPADQACCLLRLSSFTVTPLLFTLFSSGFFPCFHFPGIIFPPACACRLSCGLHLSAIIICVSLFACFLHSFQSSIKNISTFLLFIYGFYITSHSFQALCSGVEASS